jgi:RNA polymerase sigma-70 factor, ECF subfamily
MAVDLRHRRDPSSEEATETQRLFELYAARILAFCLHMLRDRDDAEDAVQTTFLQAQRALHRGVVPQHEYAWLHTIAKNVCRAQLRAGARRSRAVADADLDAIPGPALDEGEEELVRGVGDALSSLPDRQRRVLVMREWRGLSFDEVAAHLGISVPATHALLFRARRSFASALSASRRPLAGLNLAALVEQLRGALKPLVGGAAVKAAVATTAAAVVVGGVVLDQRSDTGSPSHAKPARPAATVGAEPGDSATFASGDRVTPPAATRRSRADAPVHTAPESTAPTTTARTEGTVSLSRPPNETAAPSAAPAPPPPAAETPSPSPPAPTPPVEPPVPAPVDLPPILGEELPVELPPPPEELLPPVELPPVDPPSLPVPPPPLP